MKQPTDIAALVEAATDWYSSLDALPADGPAFALADAISAYLLALPGPEYHRLVVARGTPHAARSRRCPVCGDGPCRLGNPDPMPVFVIKGKDRLAPAAIEAYRTLCEDHGLTHQATQVDVAHDEVAGWQERNPDLVKLPDHDHVPARGTPDGPGEHS